MMNAQKTVVEVVQQKDELVQELQRLLPALEKDAQEEERLHKQKLEILERVRQMCTEKN